MLAFFKPNSYDPKDWQCPKPSCRTVNFKKRLTCISCGARKPDGSNQPLNDWRDGEKDQTEPWVCGDCGKHNETGSFYCTSCTKPSPVMVTLMDEEKARRALDEGKGGGLYDRQDTSDKKRWDSDSEEYDEFGRRKRKATAQASKADKAAAAKEKQKAALERLKNKHAPAGATPAAAPALAQSSEPIVPSRPSRNSPSPRKQHAHTRASKLRTRERSRERSRNRSRERDSSRSRRGRSRSRERDRSRSRRGRR